MSHEILTALGLGQSHSGTYLGQGEWSKTRTFKSMIPSPKPIELSGIVYDTTKPNFWW